MSKTGSLRKSSRAFQTFFYFKLGYGTYFAMLFGVVNTLTSTYFLAVNEIPDLLTLFPTFESYVIVLISVGVPLIIMIGWIHMKRVGAHSAEQNVYIQESPYSYKPAPGYNIEVLFPAYLEVIRLLLRQGSDKKLSEEDERRLAKLQKDLDTLIAGGHVGTPPKGAY